jgi:uncharacterized protein involved in response to NO
MNWILYYCVAPFFICGGLFAIIRSSIVLKQGKYKLSGYPEASKNWHLASVFVGSVCIIMGTLIMFHIFEI